MSISTNGFVLTENKDVFLVLSVIESTLTELVKKYSTGNVRQDTTSKFLKIKCKPDLGFFSIYFKVKNESRILTVHFDCDCDYKEYEGSKIIWGVNYWGLAEEIVLGICKEMTQFGQVFYEVNDCDGEIVKV
jgi:hypothetical protein